MHPELDHVFLAVARDAPEAAALADFGLTEGTPNRHPGQGTANRRFFFHNAFLELLWVDQPIETQSDVVARTRLWERWSLRAQGASSLGICVRPSKTRACDNASGPPFATWQYRPPYLAQPMAIEMGMNSDRIDEPLLFYLAFGRRPDSHPPARRQPLAHPAGLRAITRLWAGAPPREAASPELSALELACPWLSIDWGGDPTLEIGFDGETAGMSHDFRPTLPLVFRW